MRKIINSFIILLFLITLSYLLTGIVRKTQKHKLISEKISKLPVFSFLTLKNQTFSSLSISSGPLLIVHFHPECEHCEYEISEILKSDIPVICKSVILVSSAEPDSIRNFLAQFRYSDYSSIISLVDTAYIFGDIFGSDIIPSNFIYNDKLNLVKVLRGEVKTESIIKYLSNSE